MVAVVMEIKGAVDEENDDYHIIEVLVGYPLRQEKPTKLLIWLSGIVDVYVSAY